MSEGSDIIRGYRALKDQKSSFQAVLDDITFYCLPEFERPEVIGDTGKAQRPVSSKPVHSTQTLGGHMFANTISTGQEWFQLRTVNGREDDKEAMQWLNNATNTALREIQNSNFSEAYGSMITLYCAFGTGVLGTDYDWDNDTLVFSNIPVNRDIYLAENEKGIISTVYRRIRYTADQAKEKFGEEALPEEVRSALYDPGKVAQKYNFIQVVRRNNEMEEGRLDWKGRPYVSTYVYEPSEEIVMRSGFWTYPFACPRFIKVREWPYGYGAAHNALFTIRELNRNEAGLTNALEMSTNPPLIVPDEDFLETADLRPNSVMVMDFTQGKPWEYPVGGGNVQLLHQRVEQLKQEVDQLFYIDVFLAISMRYKKEKTATEVQALDEEKLSSIGPMVVRLQSECFGVMLERVVDLLVEAGKIPEPPQSIMDQGFKVAYTSRVDAKLNLIQNMQVQRAAQDAAAMLATEEQVPTLGEVFRTRAAAKKMLERSMIDPSFILTDQETKRVIEQRQQAAAQQQQAEQMGSMVRPIDPQKPAEPGSPMALLEQMQGGNQSLT